MSVVEQLVPSGTWWADALHSSVRFEVEHMGLSAFRAGFTEVEASLAPGPEGPVLQGVVSVASFDVHDGALRPHVMSPEFLDAERFPELTFRSTAIGGSGGDLAVRGELTIAGTTALVEARGRLSEPIADPFGNERLAISLETVIDRTEFGLGWQMQLPGGAAALAAHVKVIVSLELVREG